MMQFVSFGSFVATLSCVAAKPPHIVLLVIDDLGWNDVGYHGSDFPTPNLDRLATQEGVRLERFYVQQVCSPTRSAFMTGRHPFHTGMQHRTTLRPGSSARLPEDVPTLPEALAKVGYRAHAIGKWHLGYASWNNTPLGRGFESWSGYLQGQGDYYEHTVGLWRLPDPLGLTGYDFWRNKTAAKDQKGKYSMEFYMEEAKRVLDSHDPAEPLFLYFAHQAQHVPLQDPPGKENSKNCAHIKRSMPHGRHRHTMCAMTNQLDQAVGEFVSMLQDKGLWEDTLLWVTSDNGGRTFWSVTDSETSVGCNYPLRGGKHTFFEGGVRTVNFVTGGFLSASVRGSVRNDMLFHVDLAFTMAGLAGAELAGEDGYNVWDVIVKGSPSPRTEIPLNIDMSDPDYNYSALIQGKWKLINDGEIKVGNGDGWWSSEPYVRSDPNASQTPQDVGGAKVFLFDVMADPEERRNVASEHPSVVDKMLRRINELADTANDYKDPQPQERDSRSYPWHHSGCWAPWLDDIANTDVAASILI